MEPRRRWLPATVLAVTLLIILVATTVWAVARERQRDQLIRDHVETQDVVAETGAAGIAAILNGFGTDLDRLSRLPSVRYLDDPNRLRRTLDSFLERSAVPVAAVLRVDTMGRILFVYPEGGLPEPALDALRTSGYLERVAGSASRILSSPVRGYGSDDLVGISDLIHPNDRRPLGAVVALFPASFLKSPLHEWLAPGAGIYNLRYADGTLIDGPDDRDPGAELPQDGAGALVSRALVPVAIEPEITLELRSTSDVALAPLRQGFPVQLLVLLLTNGFLGLGGVFLARELWLRQRLGESLRRRAELEHRLQEAQKLESIGRLAGGIAHDFNNTLTVIQGSARFIEENLAADDRNREDLTTILQAADHAADLTRQLLAFARRQTLRPRTVDLNEALHRMEPMLRRMLPEDVRITTELGACRPWIRIDPVHLEQVILNLAVNARDAMPSGGELRIATRNLAAGTGSLVGGSPGPQTRLVVADSGGGIPANALSNIFEPFFTTKPSGHGTGLGLATVYGIVKQSEGSISVESRLGEGTTFLVDLPTVSPEADGAAEENGRAAPQAPRGSTATILLVEDDAAVRRLAERALSRRGYDVVAAGTPQDALAIITQRPREIDLLVTDVVMPGMNGREVADRFGAVHPDAAILFMSGYMEDEVLKRGIASTATRFLEKPFTPADLLLAVESALTHGD